MSATTRSSGRLVAALLLAMLVQSAGTARAQDQGSLAAAEELFQEGKRLLEQGFVEKACATLARSDALEPSVGTIGLLAACHEKQGRLATAWAEYNETATRARSAADDREIYARDRAAMLEPDLPRLTISVTTPTPGLQVRRRGANLAEKDLGVEAYVDAGAVTIQASAPGRRAWDTNVSIGPRERLTVMIPSLEATQVSPPPPLPVPPPTSSTGRLAVAGVSAGVGLIGLGLMAGFGLSAASKNSDSKDLQSQCVSDPAVCDDSKALREDAQSAATVSTVGLVVGVIGLATGAVLWLTAPASSDPAPAKARLQILPGASSRGGNVLLRGTF